MSTLMKVSRSYFKKLLCGSNIEIAYKRITKPSFDKRAGVACVFGIYFIGIPHEVDYDRGFYCRRPIGLIDRLPDMQGFYFPWQSLCYLRHRLREIRSEIF